MHWYIRGERWKLYQVNINSSHIGHVIGKEKAWNCITLNRALKQHIQSWAIQSLNYIFNSMSIPLINTLSLYSTIKKKKKMNDQCLFSYQSLFFWSAYMTSDHCFGHREGKGWEGGRKKWDDLIPLAIEQVVENAEHKLQQNHYRGKQLLYSNWEDPVMNYHWSIL